MVSNRTPFFKSESSIQGHFPKGSDSLTSYNITSPGDKINFLLFWEIYLTHVMINYS